MDARNILAALKLIERARRRPDAAPYLRERAVDLVGRAFEAIDMDRALDMLAMGPDEYFRHECAVGRILQAIGAPVQADLVQLQRDPEFEPADQPEDLATGT